MTEAAKKTACAELRAIVAKLETTKAAHKHEILRLAFLATAQLKKLTR